LGVKYEALSGENKFQGGDTGGMLRKGRTDAACIAWCFRQCPSNERVRCPAFSCGKPLKPTILIHHVESRACRHLVDGVDYRGKGPETLGPLDFEYLKGVHCDARAEISRKSKLKKREEKNDKEAQFATEQAQALRK
jgi:hypothetical protein